MKLCDVQKRMPLWYKHRQPIRLIGQSGIGKSAVTKSAPAEIKRTLGLNVGMRTVNCGLLLPVHLLGFGFIDRDGGDPIMRFSKPFFMVTDEGKPFSEYDGVIVYWDEYDKGIPDVKKLIAEAAYSNIIGPHILPNNVVHWFSANRAEDMSGSTKDLRHAINRQDLIHVTPDKASLLAHLNETDASFYCKAFVQSHSEIVFGDGKLESTDSKKKRSDDMEPFCSPRSLVEADKWARAVADELYRGAYPDDELTQEEFAGRVGHSAAAQYFSDIKVANSLPSIEKIVADPKGTKIPEKIDERYLAAYKLAHDTTLENAEPVIVYIDRFPKEMGVVYAKSVVKRVPKIVKVGPFLEWTKRNASLLAQITL